MAITDILNSLFGRDQQEPSPEVPGSYIRLEEDRPEPTFLRRPSKVVTAINFVVIKAMAIIMQLVSRVMAVVLNLIHFPDAQLLRDSLSYTQLLDPIDKVNKFVRGLEDHLPNDADRSQLPPFFEGLCSQAFYMATRRAKFLFVYLTNDENEHALSIFHQIVLNPDFRRLFTNPNILIWGGDLTNPEAYQLANSLGVTKFPFLGLLCLTRSTKMTPMGPVKTLPTISLVLKIQGGLTPQTNASALIQTKFVTTLAKYLEELGVMRLELMEKYQHELMMRQMKLRYEELLQRDKLKKIHRQRKQDEDQWLRYQATHKFATPDQTQGARVAFKFNDGSRRQINIDGNRKVEDLYIYVELWNRGFLGDDGPSTLLDLSELEFNQKYANFHMQYTFSLALASPPRQKLDDVRDQQINSILAVYPSGLLVVQQHDDA